MGVVRIDFVFWSDFGLILDFWFGLRGETDTEFGRIDCFIFRLFCC